MYNIVENPIPRNAFFYTPETLGELQERIEQLTPKEKALVYTFVTQAMNVCHQLVEDRILSKEVFAQ
jgi:hypothetical protein